MRGHQHPFGTRGSSGTQGFGGRPPFGPAAFWQGLGQAVAQRARRGDVRSAILRLLSEQPMHGYQIIGELSERTGGTWKPSAGSVYPSLQLLADEGLVVAEEVGGKKVFSLTEAGTEAVAAMAEEPAPWEQVAGQQPDVAGYREAAAKLMRAAFQLGKTGTPDQVRAGVDVLNEARKRLYTILAED